MLRKLINHFTRRVTNSDLGKKVSVSWGRSSRVGTIDWISSDGGFSINFGSSVMVVPAMICNRRRNPFKNLIEL